MKKILVVEDNPQERQRAREAIERAGHSCFVAEDLHEAFMSLGDLAYVKEIERAAGIREEQLTRASELEHIKWDGVITDLHLPLLTDYSNSYVGKLEPYGLEMAIICSQRSQPCVICTDVSHHLSHWIHRVALRLRVEVIDDKGGLRDDAWDRALSALIKRMESLSHE